MLILVIAVADLAFLPYINGYAPPAYPKAYEKILTYDPDATFLEVPVSWTASAHSVSALACYWQSHHGGRTSAGYSGIGNVRFDETLVHGSPFTEASLRDLDARSFGLVSDVSFDDYAWLYLKANGFRYVVLHDHDNPHLRTIVDLDPVAERMKTSRIHLEDGLRIHDRDRMPQPDEPVIVCLDGWRRKQGWLASRPCAIGPSARLAAYIPDDSTPLALRIEATGLNVPRNVRLKEDGRELARWRVEPGALRWYETPPLRLSPGEHDWTIEVEAPAGASDQASREGRLVRVETLMLTRTGGIDVASTSNPEGH
jgi:hypothetical protein